MANDQLEILPNNPARQQVAECSQGGHGETRCDDIPPPDMAEEWRNTIPLLEEELTVLEPALPVAD